jgi:hypothetical protein
MKPDKYDPTLSEMHFDYHKISQYITIYLLKAYYDYVSDLRL